MTKVAETEKDIEADSDLIDRFREEEAKFSEPYDDFEYGADGDVVGLRNYDWVNEGDVVPPRDEAADEVRRAENAAWRNGYIARSSGATEGDCPYAGKLREYWLHGWKMGKW